MLNVMDDLKCFTMRIFVRNTVYILPFIILGLVALLAFFQHPAEDDFVCNYIVRKQGIQGAFNYYFFSKHGNGRYFSNFIFICICSSRFLLNHYYLLLLSFMVLSYTCYFIFLRYFFYIIF